MLHQLNHGGKTSQPDSLTKTLWFVWRIVQTLIAFLQLLFVVMPNADLTFFRCDPKVDVGCILLTFYNPVHVMGGSTITGVRCISAFVDSVTRTLSPAVVSLHLVILIYSCSTSACFTLSTASCLYHF